MFSSFQEKTFQKIESLFSPGAKKVETNVSGAIEIKSQPKKKMGEYPTTVKNSIEIECQGKKYAYHLGEVLNKKWDLSEILETQNKRQKKVFGGGGGYGLILRRGGAAVAAVGATATNGIVNESMAKKKTPITLRFCLFTINTKAIVPFLEFWLEPNRENVLSFPETTFYSYSEVDEEEEHSEFLDACRKKFTQMKIFKEDEDAEFFTTERMERDYHGYIVSPNENNVVYVFYQIQPSLGGEVVGTNAIIDEFMNRGKVLDKPVNPKIKTLFYSHPELLYIYGSPINPIDALIYNAKSEYNPSDESPQEIPYCLYLCKDKAAFTEEDHEGKSVETLVGSLFGVEEKHYLSPNKKYKVFKKEETELRTEDEHGYFYYFTNEIMGEETKLVKRYAVFVYNTDYRLKQSTLEYLKSLNLDKRLSGWNYWKWNFNFGDWFKGKNGSQPVSNTPLTTTITEPQKTVFEESKGIESEIDKIGESIIEFIEKPEPKPESGDIDPDVDEIGKSITRAIEEKEEPLSEPEMEATEEPLSEPETEEPLSEPELEEKEEPISEPELEATEEPLSEPETEEPISEPELEATEEPLSEPETEEPKKTVSEEIEEIGESITEFIEKPEPKPEPGDIDPEIDEIGKTITKTIEEKEPGQEPERQENDTQEPETQEPETQENEIQEPEMETDSEEEEEEEKLENIQESGETIYASIYFQRDSIPLWCIKHRLCFTAIDEFVKEKIEK